MQKQRAFRLGPDKSSRVLSSRDPETIGLFFREGASPTFVREGLKIVEPSIFIAEADDALQGGVKCAPSDVMYMAWAPCLSTKAFDLIGGAYSSLRDDFLPMHLLNGEDVFMHLPRKLIGPVDIKHCDFESIASISPFIGNGLRRLVLDAFPGDLPQIFRPSAMHASMGLSDLVATEDFVHFWESCHLQGFSFNEMEILFKTTDLPGH